VSNLRNTVDELRRTSTESDVCTQTRDDHIVAVRGLLVVLETTRRYQELAQACAANWFQSTLLFCPHILEYDVFARGITPYLYRCRRAPHRPDAKKKKKAQWSVSKMVLAAVCVTWKGRKSKYRRSTRKKHEKGSQAHRKAASSSIPRRFSHAPFPSFFPLVPFISARPCRRFDIFIPLFAHFLSFYFADPSFSSSFHVCIAPKWRDAHCKHFRRWWRTIWYGGSRRERKIGQDYEPLLPFCAPMIPVYNMGENCCPLSSLSSPSSLSQLSHLSHLCRGTRKHPWTGKKGGTRGGTRRNIARGKERGIGIFGMSGN
jgi:hypothetical protein